MTGQIKSEKSKKNIQIPQWKLKKKKKKKRKINDNVHPSQTVSLLDSKGKSAAIYRTASDFKNANEKVIYDI